uniref:Uncharacterized protein n=1 Tax=Anguilla anguilla TaxID=7936 RepID=A0A0E9WEQ6_ANGAN
MFTRNASSLHFEVVLEKSLEWLWQSNLDRTTCFVCTLVQVERDASGAYWSLV